MEKEYLISQIYNEQKYNKELKLLKDELEHELNDINKEIENFEEENKVQNEKMMLLTRAENEIERQFSEIMKALKEHMVTIEVKLSDLSK